MEVNTRYLTAMTESIESAVRAKRGIVAHLDERGAAPFLVSGLKFHVVLPLRLRKGGPQIMAYIRHKVGAPENAEVVYRGYVEDAGSLDELVGRGWYPTPIETMSENAWAHRISKEEPDYTTPDDE